MQQGYQGLVAQATTAAHCSTHTDDPTTPCCRPATTCPCRPPCDGCSAHAGVEAASPLQHARCIAALELQLMALFSVYMYPRCSLARGRRRRSFHPRHAGSFSWEVAATAMAHDAFHSSQTCALADRRVVCAAVPRKAAARACSRPVETRQPATLQHQHAFERLQNPSQTQRGATHFVLVQNNHDDLVPARPSVYISPIGALRRLAHKTPLRLAPGREHPPASPERLSPSALGAASVSLMRRFCCSATNVCQPPEGRQEHQPAGRRCPPPPDRRSGRLHSTTRTPTATHRRGQRPCGRIAQLPADQAQRTLLARATEAMPRLVCTAFGARLYKGHAGVARSSRERRRRPACHAALRQSRR
ncbi:uncharacterized protein CC84DRAFT_817148 [Paraphaeosphaeria sporulosa]|uniref:Uncharacterized protein n=1 Tax=Paraphaeosphaeria sporulosa TaxID=1460663 RepID=A0A177CBE5_9PLEO|nr:uncharacterized protein CC84DRAFT_817148 [Paraphaeosphaeria sporulosa]OAG05013.1 hypothetical protein CC84DRAFT_817148 [Paraphaeosphaeria sporulosa]